MLCAEEFVMRADLDEVHAGFRFVVKYRAIVTGDVYAPTSFVFTFEQVIVQEWMVWI
jgi:hypothetical protein